MKKKLECYKCAQTYSDEDIELYESMSQVKNKKMDISDPDFRKRNGLLSLYKCPMCGKIVCSDCIKDDVCPVCDNKLTQDDFISPGMSIEMIERAKDYDLRKDTYFWGIFLTGFGVVSIFMITYYAETIELSLKYAPSLLMIAGGVVALILELIKRKKEKE